MIARKFASALVLCSFLGACAGPGQPGYGEPGTIGMNKTTGGTLVGAGVGGLIGSQFGGGSGNAAATVLGVLAGGLIGSQIGAQLDQADHVQLQQATYAALNSDGRPAAWRNPNTGHHGTITPRPVYRDAYGQQCREFQQLITVGGQTQEGYGTACLQPDGSWRIQG